MRVLFITAGIGSEDFHAAGARLLKQASDFDIFDSLICVKESDLIAICPEIYQVFTEEELSVQNRFGFYSWKSRIANSAMKGFWGDFDTVFYLDAGCEMVPSSWNRKKLTNLIDQSIKSGIVAFSINTLEVQYSKKLLLENMKASSEIANSNQFQSGSWILSGKRGQEFARKWDEKVWESRLFVDNSISPNGEDPQFIAHRHDQSIFSILCKQFGVIPFYENPPGPGKTLFRIVLNSRFPFWWSRNRSGQTIIPKSISRILLTTLRK